MSFDVAAEAYDRFMGAWSQHLSAPFADFAGIRPGMRVLDVGCGPGSLTAELVQRLGADEVAAVDPSEPFVEAARRRYPGVDVQRAPAESLPYPDDAFDAALAQLVVHFMADPVAGLREMARVTRPGGVVAATVWDHGTDRGPISPFWRAARDLDPDVRDESDLAGARPGHLAQLLAAAGLTAVAETVLEVSRSFASFDDWWEPFTHRVGPAGGYLAGLDPDRQAELRDRCRRQLADGPFELTATSWTARGVVPYQSPRDERNQQQDPEQVRGAVDGHAEVDAPRPVDRERIRQDVAEA
jgi:SAM-dependent methyltransferase